MQKKIEKANVQDIFELNMAQKGMLFHFLNESSENLYNVQLSFDIEGYLDRAILQEAFGIVQSKNESLRSVFNWDKAAKPLQITLKECPIDFVYQDFSHLGEDEILDTVQNYSAKDRDERFDLTNLPIRLRLIKTSRSSYVFNITHHHILYDGWSSAILVKELLYCYSQLLRKEEPVFTGKPGLKEIRLAFQKNANLTEGKLFWKDYLRGYELSHFLPHRHIANTDDQSQVFSVRTAKAKLESFASEYKITQAAVIYAAFGILLKNYSDLPDVVFGTTVSGRDSMIRGMDKIIGNFINTVPLRITGLEHNTLLEITKGVNDDLIRRSQYFNTSYFEIKQLLNLSPEEDLFDCILVVENYPIDDEVINNKDKGFRIKLRSDYDNTNIPLAVKVLFREQLEIEFVYKPAKVDLAFVTSMGMHFLEILTEIINNPTKTVDSIALLSENEAREFIYGFNDTVVNEFGKETVISLFEQQVLRIPDQIAQACKGKMITYKELNDKADRIALYLAEQCGVRTGDLVGLLLEREEYLIPSILGILKAGGAYLPIDPGYPADRINSILEDSGVKILISRKKHQTSSIRIPSNLLDLDQVSNSIEAIAAVPLGVKIGLTDLAYVIYTSGSTGRPKGVMIEHKSLANYITWAAEKYVGNEAVAFPLYTSISFDLTVTSVFLPLITGNKVVVYEEDDKALLIEKVIQDNEVGIIKLTPSHLKIISKIALLRPPAENNIRRFIVGGENLETQLAKEIYDQFLGAIEIYNEYGPTEATVGCMIYKFDPKESLSSVPIGIPVANTQIYILDKLLRPCPKGTTGELYISGHGLARGYLGREELTGQRFIDNPFIPGERMYKTGDFASRLPDGNIIFNGRVDDQIKLRGYRIELGEIAEVVKSYEEQREKKPVLTDKFESFVLDESVVRCKHCLLTSNYPGITFNKDGICNVCEDYFSKKDFISSYFKDENLLESFFRNRKPSNSDYDCLLLFSGGKDSTYTLYKLMEMGLRVLTFTFDNGFISKIAFQNIKSTTEKFNVKSIVRTSSQINKVLLESLRSKSNACTGCWNSINSLGIQVAQEYGIDTIVSGLSRGQIIEMRLEGLLEAGIIEEGAINDNLQLFRKSFHSKDNVFFNLLESDINPEFLSSINFIDYFRYDPVNTEGVIKYLKSKEWIQPKDTGLCSTNCVINDVGIYLHWKKKGYHFYEAPLSWDSRLNVIEREQTINELSDSFNLKKIDAILDKIGYYDPIKIQDAVVTLKTDNAGNKSIAAYYVSNDHIDKEKLRSHVSSLLPEYMIPNFFVRLNELPLTANGKIDRKSLPDPEAGPGDYEAPGTKKERLLAGIWSKVLGIKNVSIADNFFSLGGDSIKSIQISSKLRSIGYDLSVKDILSGQTIKKIATKVTEIVFVADQSPVSGVVPLTPIQNWFFDQSEVDRNHFNQSVMLLFPQGISEETVRVVFKKLQEHHDALRMVFREEGDKIIQQNEGPDLDVSVEVHDLTKEVGPRTSILSVCDKIQSGIDLEKGPLVNLGLFHVGDGSQLLIVIHHLVVDGISWRILFEDIETLYQQVIKGLPLSLPLKTDSYQRWSNHLSEYAKSKAFQKARPYWSKLLGREVPRIKRDNPDGSNVFRDSANELFSLTEGETKKLLTEAHAPFNTQINDILLTALLLCMKRQYGHDSVLVDIEGHGREEVRKDVNISRTVGWFTSIYPVLLEKGEGGLSQIIKHVKETLREVPNNGIDYLVYKYLDCNGPEELTKESHAQISFNYLGQFDADIVGKSYTIVDEPRGYEVSQNISQAYDWNIIGEVSGKQLRVRFMYSKEQYKTATIRTVLNAYKEHLLELIEYCCTYRKVEVTPSDLTFKDLSISELDELSSKYDLEDIYPLSPMQEGMLFHSLLDKTSSNYFVQKTIGLKGNLDINHMEKSLNGLINRHEILRTVFLHKGLERPLQLVLKEKKVEFNYVDIQRDCLGALREEIIQSYREKDKVRTFDPGKDVLMRATVLRTAEDEYEFIWSYHHIVMDGWCTNIIWNEFKTFYLANRSGIEAILPAVKKYAEYINWLEKRDKDEAVKYWTGALSGYTSLATLPKTEPAQADEGAYKLKSTELIVNKMQTALLHKVCGKYGVTSNTILQCAWGLLLARYNNTNDVVFGLVVSGRPPEIEGIETMVGLFINTIPIRINYKVEDTIGSLLVEMQHAALENENHHYHPLQEIQSLSELGRELLDNIMVFENYPMDYKAGGSGAGADKLGFTVTDVQLFEQTNYDLSLIVYTAEEIRIRMDYNGNRYSPDTIEHVAFHLQHLIGEIILKSQSRITDIELLEDTEKQQLLLDLNNTRAEYPQDKTVIDLFTEQVGRTPRNIAIKHGDENISYEELDRRSTRLAVLLRKNGVARNDIVGLLMDRSAEVVIAMLAILKAGGAYLPIDVDYPDERIEYLVKDSDARVILTSRKLGSRIAYAERAIFIDDALSADNEDIELTHINQQSDLCYIIYTSGTTGNPKGVMIEHKNVVRLFFNDKFQFDFGATDVWTMFHSPCFDFSVWEMYGALLFGGKLVIIPRIIAMDSRAYLEILKKEKVTILNQTPSSFYNLMQEEICHWERSLSLRYVIFGGEALSPRKLKPWWSLYPYVRLVNMFGITETTVHVTYKEIGEYEIENNISNIGKPIPTLTAYILDKDQKLMPKGAIGELYIGGAGVSRGYLRRKELTNQKFVNNPFEPGERLYRSGDLARVLESGDIEYIGRMDDQVKIRGFRIELSEIENQLSRHNEVREAVVLAKGEEGNKYLVAYYVSGNEIEEAGLRMFLNNKLPDYMLPSYYVYLRSLPLTGNGKLDKKALPEPVIKAVDASARPRNQTQKDLIKIWADLLGIEENKIGLNTNFFDIGGNSLKLVKMADKINSQFNAGITVAKIFAHPVISLLAAFLDEHETSNDLESVFESNAEQMNEAIGLFNQTQG